MKMAECHIFKQKDKDGFILSVYLFEIQKDKCNISF